jgi:glycosyltransferase involved in cell wall biosynthesis
MTERDGPLVSVLTPVRNYEQFIGECVESVRALSTADVPVEHLVADGASTDGTATVLAALEGDSLSWWSRPDSGQSDALNQALDRARGEWIGWLNADEFYLPGAASVMKRLQTTDADVVVGECTFVDSQGRFLRLLGSHQPSRWMLRHYGCCIASCATFVRREIVPPNAWDLNFRTAMDWDLWLTLADRGAKFEFVPITVAAFRVHAGQVTAAHTGVLSSEYRAIRRKHGVSGAPWRVITARLAGRCGRLALKLRSGAYMRQVRARRQPGASPARWRPLSQREPRPR